MSAQDAPPPPPTPPRPAGNPSAFTGDEARHGFRTGWYPLLYIALFAWIDYRTHLPTDAIFFIVVVFGGSTFLILFRRVIGRELAKRGFDFGAIWRRVPARVRPAVVAIPGLLYFSTRYSQGYFGGVDIIGEVVLVTVVCIVVVVAFGPAIDSKLAGFYAARNSILPREVRMLLVPVLAVVISFGLIHGSLADLPAFLGIAPTTVRARPSDPGTFVLATVAASAIGFLLLRDARRGPAVPPSEPGPPA